MRPAIILRPGLVPSMTWRTPADALEPLRLANVIEQARQENPQLRAAQQRAKAAAAIPPRVSALDDPTVSYEEWNAPNSFRPDRADNNIVRLAQKFPFPGKRRLAGTMAEQDAEVAQRESESIELDVVTAVKRAFYDLWAAHQMLLVYSREQALAGREYYPDLEVSVGRFINPGCRDGVGAMATVSIPIAYKWKYDAAVAEASARLASAQAELRRTEDRVRGEVKEAFLRARAALLQRNLFLSTHIPQAEQSLKVAQSGYETRAIDFLALMDKARAIESVHVDHIDAEAEFHRAYADLERAIGKDLPRRAHGATGHELE